MNLHPSSVQFHYSQLSPCGHLTITDTPIVQQQLNPWQNKLMVNKWYLLLRFLYTINTVIFKCGLHYFSARVTSDISIIYIGTAGSHYQSIN